MHLNYYFLRQLTAELRQRLLGFGVVGCFSQEKDELVIAFARGREEFHFKAILTSRFTALSFPERFNRARANSVNLFQPIIGASVQDLVQHENERSFAIELSGDLVLLFKMFGNRSNIILFHHHEPVELFHQKLRQDLTLRPQSMPKRLPQEYADFISAGTDVRRVFPTLGEVPLRYLQEKGFAALPPDQKWALVQEMLFLLQSPTYYLVRLDGKTRLSLLPLGEIRQTFGSALEASQAFVNHYLREYHFETAYQRVYQQLQNTLQRARKVQAQAEQKLKELQQDFSYSQTADLIMANLTNIPPQAEQVEVYDFYADQPRTIKLKSSETPQKFAERLYKKGKNRQIELKLMEEKIFRKEEQIQETEARLAQLEQMKDYRQLKAFLKENPGLLDQKTQEKDQLFREFELQSFKILVGKNARNNDLLTLKHAFKEDLWLHAKDVSGSHVVVKYQSGRKFPESVIEAAAELAAHYSKRKNDTLCPVTFTPRKYVRKPKGAEPGAVIVEREKVILVQPRNPFEQI
jgi:predicted ribosome quality control (RQC) complex YloA/Tae2 family protein